MKTLANSLLSLLFICACYITLVNSRKDCSTNKKISNSKLICYYSNVDDIDGCYCTHVILPSNSDVKIIERVRERAKGVKVYVTVNEFNQGLINLLKSSKIDGLEINLKKLDSKNDISDFISTVKSKIGSALEIALSVPSKSDLIAKYFNFKALSKHTDLFILQTAFLGASTNVTFHPSRLSGMWDMQNTDSVVDLIIGLGAPLSKLVIAAPVQAFQFTLQNEEYTALGSPAVELKSLTRNELCKLMNGGKNWTLERDEDQAGPYIFRKKQWIAFEDLKSIDIKAKYSRIRGLAGIALKDLAQDGGAECGSTILEATYNGLSRQARAPRGAVLHSLEREILESPTKPFESIQLSPYRISRIIDTEGNIHITRQDTKTEFQCSRQGYFVHPRSCNRFYRCVKFDQRFDDFNVFEFDCPAGLAFDERVEVCVWPGSLSHGTPCSGSSEIAPVPRKRFECPSEPGYYADPENCRWFFACLDHGKSPLSAYEFRCPFGLGFDGERLMCEWPWLVPNCAGAIGLDSEYYYGGVNANGGYEGKGTLAPGLLLQNYDGLGILGTTKLGGIVGQIDRPIATVYSNVGSGTLGLGYQNNGGYITEGGLSYKAAKSLANAGLLKVNNGAGYQAIGQAPQGTIYTTSHLGSGNANIQYSLGTGAQAAQGGQYIQNEADSGVFLINANGNYDSGAGAYATGRLESSGNLQYQGRTGQYQDSNLHLVQGSLGGAGFVSADIFEGNLQGFDHGIIQQPESYAIASGTSGQYQGISDGASIRVVQENIDNNAYVTTDGQFQAISPAIQSTGYIGATVTNLGKQDGGYITTSGNANQRNSGSYFSGKTDVSSQHGGSDDQYQGTFYQNTGGDLSSQSYIQYHGQQENKASEAYDSGVSGNINIIGGGYSAVGTLADVQVLNNGKTDDVKTVSFSSTPSPIAVTTYTPVSTISSVPTITAVPVPGIKTSAGFETFRGGVIANIPELQYRVKSHGDTGFLANISSSFANFVVTTPPTVTKEVVQQIYSQGGGYIYEKPKKPFEDGPLNSATLSTVRPFVTVSTEEPKLYVSSTVKPLSIQTEYVYEKPSVTFEENPVVYSTPKPAISTITYQKYNTNGGYNYEKPLVTFKEEPLILSTAKPTVYLPQPQVYVSSTPAAPATTSKFTIRKPILHQQAAVINDIPTVQLEQKALVNNYAYRQPVQPAVISQYYYQQPSVQRQPIVPLYKQPELLTTYTYQPPVQKTVYKQPLSTYTYQNVAQESVGITDAQQQITLVQKPEQKYFYQPSGGTNYQYIKFDNNLQGKSAAFQSKSFQYPKPSISFKEEPQWEVVSTYQYSTPKPNIIIQKTEAQEGYVYEKPAVTFEETPVNYLTPKPIIAIEPTVTNYFNIGNSKSTQPAVKQEHVDYSYQPIVKETPVTYSTSKPVIDAQPVTPAVLTSYFNIQSSTPKPDVYVQAPIIYSTPKPFAAQPIVAVQEEGYNYPKPEIKLEESVSLKSAVANSYNYFASSTPKPDILLQQNVGYSYPQPEIFEEKPVQPAAVSSYHFAGSTTPQPNIIVEQKQLSYTPKSQVIVEDKSAVVGSYFHQHPSQFVLSKGYKYQKPSVQFVEEPQLVKEAPFVKKTAYVTGQYQQQAAVGQEHVGYSYQPIVKETPVTYSTPKPVITVQPVTPAVVTSYFNIHSSTPKEDVYFQEPYIYSTPKPIAAQSIVAVQKEGYNYPKPQIKFEESVSATPAIVNSYSFIASSSPQPDIVVQQKVDYSYPKPEISFEEKPVQPAVVSSYNFVGSTTPQSNILVEQKQPSYAPKPHVIVEHKPAVVTSYFRQQPSQLVSSKGYEYPKPSIQFVEEPQLVQEVPFVKKTAYVTSQYQQNSQENYNFQQSLAGGYQHTGKVVVENYVHPNYEKVKQAVFGQNLYQQQGEVEYQQPQVLLNYVQSTPKPSFVSTIKTIAAKKFQAVTPATVTFYDSRHHSTPVTPIVSPQIDIISTTSRPISRYSFSSLDDQYQYNQNIGIIKSTTPEPASYDYIGSATPQLNIVVEEQQPINYTPKPQLILEHKPAVVTSYFHQQPSQPVAQRGYTYPKPSVQFVEEPKPVLSTYNNREPVQELPFIKDSAYVTGHNQQNTHEKYNYQQNSQGSYQHTGKIVVENYLHPNYEKVKQVLVGQKVYQNQEEVEFKQPQVVLNYVHPTPRPSFISTVKEIAIKDEPVTPATVTFYDSRYSSTPESYVLSTVAPKVNIVSTTSRPKSKYSFSSQGDQYQYNKYLDIVKSTTSEPTRTYLPVTSRVRVTSELPRVTTTKVVEEYVVPEVTTLTRDYLPVKIRTKAPAREYLPAEINTPSREYLPSRQRIKVTSSSAAPEVTTLFRDYLPIKSRIRVTTTGAPLKKYSAVIKQNDAHPLLSAKLGAQCTCVSNGLKLRKKQKIIIVDDDDQNDDNEDDGYIVDDGSQGNFVESNYESQRVVDITPSPEVYVQSTSLPSQAYRKNPVKVRPVLKQSYLPVTEVSDIFYRRGSSLVDSTPSDKEIAEAVRTGLKLVKQAAKEGAREGAEEALSGKQFDRYGPGGVRSRTETLQGSIDCQRAGLFRHPTQCNKFYACRWDCTKNRFTLHVFNCPVHLTFDNTLGACNWPSQGPACVENTLITSD